MCARSAAVSRQRRRASNTASLYVNVEFNLRRDRQNTIIYICVCACVCVCVEGGAREKWVRSLKGVMLLACRSIKRDYWRMRLYKFANDLFNASTEKHSRALFCFLRLTRQAWRSGCQTFLWYLLPLCIAGTNSTGFLWIATRSRAAA